MRVFFGVIASLCFAFVATIAQAQDEVTVAEVTEAASIPLSPLAFGIAMGLLCWLGRNRPSRQTPFQLRGVVDRRN